MLTRCKNAGIQTIRASRDKNMMMMMTMMDDDDNDDNDDVDYTA